MGRMRPSGDGAAFRYTELAQQHRIADGDPNSGVAAPTIETPFSCLVRRWIASGSACSTLDDIGAVSAYVKTAGDEMTFRGRLAGLRPDFRFDRESFGAREQLPGLEGLYERLGLVHGGYPLLCAPRLVAKGLGEGIEPSACLPHPANLLLLTISSAENQALAPPGVLPEKFQCRFPFGFLAEGVGFEPTIRG